MSFTLVGDTQCVNPGGQVHVTGTATWTPRSDGRESDPDGPDQDDQPPTDVSDQIVVRNQVRGGDFIYTVTASDVRHTKFTGYVGTVAFATVIVPVAHGCPGLDRAGSDALKLAVLLYLEGNTAGGGATEQRAQAYVVVNRSRFGPQRGHGRGFPATIGGVIEQAHHDGGHEFTSLDPNPATGQASRYWCWTTATCRTCLTATECAKLTALLKIAEDVIADPTGAGDPVMTTTGQRAFFFIRSATHAPGPAAATPLLWEKGAGAGPTPSGDRTSPTSHAHHGARTTETDRRVLPAPPSDPAGPASVTPAGSDGWRAARSTGGRW